MPTHNRKPQQWRGMYIWPARIGAVLLCVQAAAAPAPLGGAASFAVLGASTVANTGPTSVTGDLGVFPGTAITGLGSVTLVGTVHSADAAAQQAQTDAMLAYQALAAQPAGTVLTGQDLGGMLLLPGVYTFASSAQLTGTLTLDAGNDPQAAFVFRIGSTLTTASNAAVTVLNGNASQLQWQVGSSATLGTGTTFMGTLLAAQSITMTTGSSIMCGRALALSGAVTMDTNTLSTFCPPVGVVPEPASWALFGAGLLALARLVWQRRQAAPGDDLT